MLGTSMLTFVLKGTSCDETSLHTDAVHDPLLGWLAYGATLPNARRRERSWRADPYQPTRRRYAFDHGADPGVGKPSWHHSVSLYRRPREQRRAGRRSSLGIPGYQLHPPSPTHLVRNASRHDLQLEGSGLGLTELHRAGRPRVGALAPGFHLPPPRSPR